MKKYILKQTGKEVKVGDTIEMVQPIETIFGKTSITQDVVVDQQKLDILIKNGLVKEQEEQNDDVLKPYIRRIARKMGYPFFGVVAFLQSLTEVSVLAAYDLLLLQVSKDLNKGKDLRKYKTLLVVGRDGKVQAVANDHIDLNQIPVFTSEEDAEKAIGILPNFHEFLYGEQENH